MSIGPYAQANGVSEGFVLLAGQIALLPATMTLHNESTPLPHGVHLGEWYDWWMTQRPDSIPSPVFAELGISLHNAAQILNNMNSAISRTTHVTLFVDVSKPAWKSTQHTLSDAIVENLIRIVQIFISSKFFTHEEQSGILC
jgi:hypothetical protein